MNAVYKKVAVAFNDLENYRTDSEYNDALIFKTISFQFLNSYSAAFYVAFIKSANVPMGALLNLRDSDDKFYREMCGRRATAMFGSLEEAYSEMSYANVNPACNGTVKEDCNFIFVENDCFVDLRGLMISYILLKPIYEIPVQIMPILLRVLKNCCCKPCAGCFRRCCAQWTARWTRFLDRVGQKLLSQTPASPPGSPSSRSPSSRSAGGGTSATRSSTSNKSATRSAEGAKGGKGKKDKKDKAEMRTETPSPPASPPGAEGHWDEASAPLDFHTGAAEIQRKSRISWGSTPKSTRRTWLGRKKKSKQKKGVSAAAEEDESADLESGTASHVPPPQLLSLDERLADFHQVIDDELALKPSGGTFEECARS